MPVTTSALPALAPTADTRSMTERFNAVLKNLYNKILPVGVANTVLTSDGTTFSWAALPAGAITNTGATTFLGSDVGLGTAAAFLDGPNTGSTGANGQTWLIISVAALANATGSSANMEAAIFNGSVYIANSSAFFFNTETKEIIIMAVVSLSAATTFTLRARNANGLTGATLLTTGQATGVANKATSITAVRLA